MLNRGISIRSKIYQLMVLVSVVCTAFYSLRAQTPAPSKLPSFKSILQETQKVLGGFENYEPGDMISRKQATVIIIHIEELGWKIPDKQKFIDKVPNDDELLIKTLHSTKGRSFMRQCSKLPNGFDRVDRISQLSNGRDMLKQLVDAKDGVKLIEYLTETEGGKMMGNMVSSKEAKGKFNDATGRIYTAKTLLALLHPLHEQAELNANNGQ